MMMLDGPRAPPAAGGKPNMLVALLHGYGSNGADLISLAPYWAKALPHAAFVSPNAPEPVPGAPGGYQWWDLMARGDPLAMEQGAKQAAGALERYFTRELERLQLEPNRLALVGFSQGTMMSLYVGPRRIVPPAGIVGFSGMLIGGERLKEEAKAKPPILLVHGDRDDRIPLGAMFQAADGLCEAGLSAQWHVSYGVPHSIGPDGLELAGAFLKTVSKGFSLAR
ncbi:MAG: dienelactone hydrolase family protein [Hyphomonadaceae bacterium]|nr:dienelactone hydrolase family protein [Hyphomonadaceae bacterium]